MQAFRERHSHGDRSFPFEAIEQSAPASQTICYLHWHDEVEWSYIAEGAIDVVVDGTTYRVRAGQMFAVDERLLHQVIAVEDCHQYVCVFDKRLLAFALADFVSWQYINPYTEGKFTIASPVDDTDGTIGSAFASIVRDCFEKPTCFQLDVKLNLLKVFEVLIKTGHLVEGSRTPRGREPIEAVLGYIEEHYSERISSRRLADLVGYNAQYFSRYFKRFTGLSPTDYINRYRIEHACEQLLDPDRSILDISVSCGFQSTSYFIKKFKELKGVPPKRYRAMLDDNSTNWSEHYAKNDFPSNAS